MDILKIIKEAAKRGEKWKQAPLHPGCSCGCHQLFPHKTWMWLHNRDDWRKVRAWILGNQLNKDCLEYIDKHFPEFVAWMRERDE